MPAKKHKKEYVTTAVMFAPNNPHMDVGRWYDAYMSKCVRNAKYLFHSEKGEQLSPSTPPHCFKRLFVLAGLDFTGFGGHSGRVGGTTAMMENAVNEYDIKYHGSWDSNAYLRYGRLAPRTVARATSHLNM